MSGLRVPLGGYAAERAAALAFDALALTLAGGCVVLQLHLLF